MTVPSLFDLLGATGIVLKPAPGRPDLKAPDPGTVLCPETLLCPATLCPETLGGVRAIATVLTMTLVRRDVGGPKGEIQAPGMLPLRDKRLSHGMRVDGVLTRLGDVR